MQKLFSVSFLRPPSKVTNFYTSPMPPFWKFFIKYIEQWTKTFSKKPVDWAGQKPVDRSVDRPINWRWFWNLPVGSGRENPDRFHLWFRPSPCSKVLVMCQTQVTVSDLPIYNILSHKRFLFPKFLMTSLYLICSLPPHPPSIKNPGYAYAPNLGMSVRMLQFKLLGEWSEPHNCWRSWEVKKLTLKIQPN